jgi:hypothetical protein
MRSKHAQQNAGLTRRGTSDDETVDLQGSGKLSDYGYDRVSRMVLQGSCSDQLVRRQAHLCIHSIVH